MTDKEVVRVVGAAVQGIEEVGCELKTIRKLGPGSNVWKVLCSAGEFESELTLYVFPDATPEELSKLTQDRLSLQLPRW